MRILHPVPEVVPFDEVAAVLEDAITRLPGGPPASVAACGRHLAGVIEQAGWRVVRDGLAGGQLTL